MNKKHYLLIADDEPLSQFIYQELFADDFEVELVEDGLACMDSLSKRLPDALILDVSMPGMSGFEVCERLRTDSRFPRLPILLVSGHASEADRQKGLSLGADDYLSKPFPVFELKELLTRLVNGQAASAATGES
jgi:DNA-binding response OmpR family regulator